MTCTQAVVAVLVLVVAQAAPATAGAQGQVESGSPPPETRAAPPRLAPSDAWLEWATTDVSGGCIDARGFADQVTRSLGRSPLAAAREAHVMIATRIERASPPGQPPRWSGEIRVRDDRGRWVGSRTLDREGLSCRPLADALALATALVLAQEDAAPVGTPSPPPPELPAPATRSEPAGSRPQETFRLEASTANRPQETSRLEGSTAARPQEISRPQASTADRPQETSRPQASTAPHPPELSARAEAAPPPAPARPWSLGVEGGLALAVGVLPDPSLGGTVAVFWQLGARWKVFAAGGTWSQQMVSTGSEQGATLKLTSLGAGVCPFDRPWRGFSGRACARVDGGRLRATGFGFAKSTVQDSFTVDAAAGVEVRRPLVGPVYASLSVALAVPFIRDRISYSDNQGAVHSLFRPSPVAGTGELRLGTSF